LTKVAAWSPAPDRFENRVSSITADNKRALEETGVWQHVELGRTRGIENMEVRSQPLFVRPSHTGG
jgi:hypothetical protein